MMLWQRLLPTDPLQHPLEKQLAFPIGTLGVLEQAFVLHLDRKTPWVAGPLLNSDEKNALACAASIYKRGVSYLAEENILDIKEQSFDPFQTKFYFHPKKPFISKNCFLIVDKNVDKFWRIKKSPYKVVVCLDETSKNLSSIARILKVFRGFKKPSLSWKVIGGGLVCDVAMFAAYLVKASCDLYPTTLLAMVDASVGGKSGVNHPIYGKNQIGAFYFPKRVHIWPGWLQSLDIRQKRAGLSESIKQLLVGAKTHLRADWNINELLTKKSENELLQIVTKDLRQIILIKQKIVDQDPREVHLRSVLNFGHTFAHSLEAYAAKHAFDLLHGEAVALGMVYESLLSHRLGHLSEEDLEKILCLLKQAQILPSPDPLKQLFYKEDSFDILWDQLWQLMLQDKKNEDQAVLFVLLKEPGAVCFEKKRYTFPADESTCKRVWTDFISRFLHHHN